MDFGERFLVAMHHEEPDRVPVMGLIAEPATSNKILGKPPADIVGMLSDPELRGQIKDIVNSSWRDLFYANFADAIEAAVTVGFDANWAMYTHMEVVDDPQARTGVSWHDIHGRVWEQSADEQGNVVMNYVGGTCTTEDEWYAWRDKTTSFVDGFVADVADCHRRLVDTYADRIMLVGYTDTGIFESTWQSMGFVNFIRFMYQNPAFVKEVIDFKTDLYLKSINAILQSGVGVVMGGDDLGQKTGPLMRPDQLEDLFGESYRRVSELVHKHDRKLLWHSCGNVYALLDKFVEWGFDGFETIEPTAGMDLGSVREMVGHKLVLVGNLDVSHLLVRGTRDEVEGAVKKAIADAATGGGYILSPSHSHIAVDPTRLSWMIEATHKWGRYPIGFQS